MGVVRAADRIAVIVRNAIENQYNWEFDLNGESLTLELALRHHSGDVFDVGSNVGQWAMQALPRLDGKSLHCFEAVPAIFRRFRQISQAIPGYKSTMSPSAMRQARSRSTIAMEVPKSPHATSLPGSSGARSSASRSA